MVNNQKDEIKSGMIESQPENKKMRFKQKFKKIWQSFKEMISLKEKSKLYGFLIAIYTMLVILAGLASSILIPIVDDSTGTTGVNLVTSMAFPLSAGFFVISNMIAEIFGKKKATFALIIGYLMGMFVSFWLFLGWILLKNNPANNYYGGPDDHFFPFDALGPSWRFFIAGMIAFGISTSINVAMIWGFKKKYKGKRLTARLFLSSLIGQATDNMIFGLIAFSPLGLTAIEFNFQTIFALAWFEWALEIVVELSLTPLIEMWIKKIQRSGLYEDLDGKKVFYEEWKAKN